jgi:hypothetical protein
MRAVYWLATMRNVPKEEAVKTIKQQDSLMLIG